MAGLAGSDNPAAAGLSRAQGAGIPTFSVNYSDIIKGVRQGSVTPPDDFDFKDSYSKQGLFEKDVDPEKVRNVSESRAACEFEFKVKANFFI